MRLGLWITLGSSRNMETRSQVAEALRKVANEIEGRTTAAFDPPAEGEGQVRDVNSRIVGNYRFFEPGGGEQ